MELNKQVAKHFRDVHFGGNWTFSNMKEVLSGISWQQATTRVYNCNTIATLVFHINYFTAAALKVLQGEALNAHDKYSFDHPPIHSQEDWESMVNKALNDAEQFAALVEQLPEEQFWKTFADEKYGNYYRNIHGIIEHTHYHLGQIAIIKKIVQQKERA